MYCGVSGQKLVLHLMCVEGLVRVHAKPESCDSQLVRLGRKAELQVDLTAKSCTVTGYYEMERNWLVLLT